ncbi:MAG: hypothetical protein H6612_02525 [Ignavibacteriales bacterium]|nr:hypothetical protein [Ignavibacteriales bacterium]
MSNETILYLGGIYNVILIIFHLSFWKIFNWKKELSRMNFLNRNVYQILNISLTFIFVIFAYLSFFYNHELLVTPLGNITLKLISFFWFFRTLQQIYFFGIKNLTSIGFTIFLLVGAIIYFIPAY